MLVACVQEALPILLTIAASRGEDRAPSVRSGTAQDREDNAGEGPSKRPIRRRRSGLTIIPRDLPDLEEEDDKGKASDSDVNESSDKELSEDEDSSNSDEEGPARPEEHGTASLPARTRKPKQRQTKPKLM